MNRLNSLCLNIIATGRAPMYLRLAVMALSVAGALMGVSQGTVFAEGDDGGGGKPLGLTLQASGTNN